MPTFPFSRKKGPQPSPSADVYGRPDPRSAQYPPPSLQQPPSQPYPSSPLQHSPNQPYPAVHSSSRSLEANDLPQPGHPYGSAAAAAPYPSDPSSRPAPALEQRTTTASPEPRKLFKKKFGLSASRDNLLDTADDSSASSLSVRRTLSTSRPARVDSRHPPPQHLNFQNPQSGRSTPTVARRSTLATQDSDGNSGQEAEDLRDLADFFRSTAPTGDPRRPISLIGNSSQAQSHWSSQRPAASADSPTGSIQQRRRNSYEHSRGPPQPIYEATPQQEENRTYEPYNASQSIATHAHPQQDSSASYSALAAEHNVSLRQDRGTAFPEPSRGPHAVHGGAASELNAHLSVQPVHHHQQHHHQTLDSEDNLTESPRSPVLADMPGAPGSLQPPPRRGSVESSEPPTPGMQKQQMAAAGQQGAPRPQNGQDAMSGRRTPEPALSTGDMGEQDVQQLMRDYKELREKYSKVKRYYFEKEDQVKTLQNALAHQKLSQSRTSLDDGEYMARLTRLDGLISQLAFNFRKDWQSMPAWIQPYVNKDAIAVGKQEMTAVGRAFISRWLVDEVFDRYFHPGLEFEISRELKTIQRNIRVFTPVLQTGEEEEALTNKIINWRLATMDGLQHVINSPEAAQRRQTIVELLTAQMVGHLLEHMNEPAPAGLDGAVHMIMELVVAILVHLPFESRDVSIEYFLPGQPILGDLMRVEQGIPALVNPMAELPVEDRGSVRSHSSELQRDEMQEDLQAQQQMPAQLREESAKKGLFGGLMSGNKKGPPAKGNGGSAGGGAGTSQSSLLQPPGSSGGPKEERVRLCVSLGLQIRGKMVLSKAPVFKM